MSDSSFVKFVVGGILFVLLMTWLVWSEMQDHDIIYAECMGEKTHSEHYCRALANGAYSH